VPNVFKRLTRGIKLLIEHIYTPVAQTMTLLTGTGVSTDNLKNEDGTFRITLNFPYISPFASNASASLGRSTTATSLFILPALQDQFTSDSEEIENYELVEISVGQDTRCESAHITGYQGLAASSPEGTINYGLPSSFSLHISGSDLSTSLTNEFDDEVFKLTIPDLALTDTFRTANPFVQTGINVQMRHDKAYIAEIVPTHAGRGMYSFTVSMKFKTKLRQRDRGAASVQNLPTAHNGAFTPAAQAPVLPASNSTILADGASGVNTAFSLVDTFVRNRLKGGYKQDGSIHYSESILTDAGYEVIAVPLFAPLHVKRDVPGAGADNNDIYNSWQTLPYSSAGAFNTFDRVLVPIHYPIVIHHVLAAVNYSPSEPAGSRLRPTSTTFTNQVGVGMMTGIRSDLYAMQQVATATWNPVGGAAPITGNRFFTGNTPGSSWDLVSVPLVGTGGLGYTPQGKPVFVGSGTNVTDARSNIAGGASATQGLEQALDIRWKISDTTLPSAWGADETIIGYPGHWIYIIGKKHLI